MTLTGANTYSGGTTIDGGILVAPIAGALPGYNVVGEVAGQSGGTLVVDLGTGKWTAANLSALLTDAVFNGGSVLGLDTGNGDFEYDDVIGGALSLSKLGSGTLLLTAANTYSGDTFIRNGTLEVAGGDDRLPTGTTLTLGDAANDTSGVLQLGDGTTARNQTLAALINDMDYQYDAGADLVVGGGSGAATLTLNLPAGADYEFDGVLGGSGTYQNNLALRMIGPGTEELGAVNTYGGGTTLDAGVLQVWNAEALGSGSVTVGGGVLRNLATTDHHLYYVDPDGMGGPPSDTNDGSIHSPFATLQEAYNVAQPGDTIIMRGGTYHAADLGYGFDIGGLPGLPLTIEAAPGEHPIIDLATMEQWQQDANGCWYTDLPNYTGEPCVEIINGWAATPVSGAPVNGGPPLALTNPDVDYYQNGQLAFDLTWYDAANNRLWFRSNEIEPITDPDTQCGVVGSQGFEFYGGSWITIKGIQIQNGYIGIHICTLDAACDHEIVEDCRITHMWNQGILISGNYDEISNNYVDAIGGQLANGGREWLQHDLYADGQGYDIHDNFFGRSFSGGSVQLECDGNVVATSTVANNVCYGGQLCALLVSGKNIIVTGNVAISPSLLWRGSPVPSYLRDPGTAELGVYLYAPWACSNIVLSGNYIEGAGRALAENDMPSGPTMQGVVVTGNTVAGGQDLFMAMPPEEMESNQWGGALGGSAFQMGDMAIPGWLYFDYDEFLDWAQGKGFGTRSADTPTSLIDMSNFDPQLDAGLSLSQAMALFRTYATGKVDAFAACPAVAQSSTLGGVTTPNINGNLPQAGNDAWSLTAGTTLVVKAAQGVLANDSDPDYELLTAMLVSQPKYGQLTLNSDGSFSYTPNENVSGTDTFTYLASDGHGGTAMATVVLNIQLVPTVNVTDAGGVYNGAPFPATATLTTPGNTQVASLGGVSPTLVYYVGSLTTEQLATATALPDAPSAVGTYTVVASFGGIAGYVAAQSAPIIFKITPAVPQVVGVSVSGSAWTSSSLVGGYSIPVGGGAQLFPLPAANINQIEVTFNENVIVDQSDLLLTGVNVPSYDVSGGTFSYDPTTFTAIWTLPQPIGPDKLMLTLNADGSDPIRDAAGNRLDGEWTNPTSTTDTGGSTYLSGNGVAGGDFDFRFNVLPGDAAQDGTVDGYALSQILVNYNSSGKTWADGDFNGDGIVDGYDLVVLLVNYNQTLPSGEPAAGSFPADVSFAAATLPTAANSEATVPSQADVIPNVAMADNCMLEEPDVLAAALPTRPATV